MKTRFTIEALKFLRANKLKQLKLIRDGGFYLHTVITLTDPTISLSFDSIKNLTYEEAINLCNKSYYDYQIVNIDKPELERFNDILDF